MHLLHTSEFGTAAVNLQHPSVPQVHIIEWDPLRANHSPSIPKFIFLGLIRRLRPCDWKNFCELAPYPVCDCVPTDGRHAANTVCGDQGC